jgi:hypothetical protein
MTRNHGPLVVLAALSLLMAGCGADSPVTSIDDSVLPPPTQLDTAPPATPTGICALVQVRRVKLGWDPNVTDPDCAGFILSRTASGATVHLIADPLDLTTFVDTHPYVGFAVYEVCAVDTAGNTSAAATFAVDFHAEGAEREIGI